MTTPQTIPGHTILHGTFEGSTDKALKFLVDTVDESPWESNQKSFWIPYSQIHSDFRDAQTSGEDWVIITNWIAKKIGFI